MSRTAENANRGSSGLPLRAIAMLLISLAILFAGLGFASLGGSDEDAATTAAATTETTSETSSAAVPAPATARPPASAAGSAGAAGAAPDPATSGSSPGAGAAGAGTSTPGTSSPDSAGTASPSSPLSGATASSADVRVYNNSNVAGLAAQTATLLEDEGFTISETGNYSEGLLAQTSVYYGTGSGEQETAEAVAGALGVTAQPRFDGIEDSAPGVIVIVAEP